MKLFNLPNTLTLINLLAGCLALVFIFTPGNPQLVFVCTVVSLVADFLDGFAARFTKTASPIGKELDSLADVVSFGAVPGAMVFSILSMYFRSSQPGASELPVIAYAAPGFLITLFSALRLAKFNLDERQTEGFIGLATPANTLFFSGLWMMILHNEWGLTPALLNPLFLYLLTVLFSFLLIAELPMFSFKFKQFGWKGNELRWVAVIAAMILIPLLHFAALSLLIVLYILLSVVLLLTASKNK
ncbi:MAG: CDP-alcohol phosphatidyltransferase family protein [Chitinophagales bacterium]